MMSWVHQLANILEKSTRVLNGVLFLFVSVGLAWFLALIILIKETYTINGVSISLNNWQFVPSLLLALTPVIILMRLHYRAQSGETAQPASKPPASDERVARCGKSNELLAEFAERVEAAAGKHGIKSVQAVVHTGQVSILTLNKVVNGTTRGSGKIRVLLRTPDYEDYWRSSAFNRTQEYLKDFGFDYNFYSAPPFVHGFLIEYGDGSHEHFYSFYLHTGSGRTQIDDAAYLDVNQGRESFYKIFNSWFEYYWGKSNHKIHTIIFDFDDTIADTGFIQVEAWVEAVQQLPTNRRALLSKDVLEAIETSSVVELMLTRFKNLQMADKIIGSLFRKGLPPDTVKVAAQELQDARLVIRKRRTREALLFPKVLEVISKLSDDYYLAIMSATDEQVVRDYLRVQNMHQYFGYIYGKFAPYDSWSEQISIKTQNLIKMSSILGVPLSRLAYVGDSDGDFRASKQVGVKFVEARLEKRDLGSDTLIRSLDHRVYFSDYQDLPAMLQSFEDL